MEKSRIEKQFDFIKEIDKEKFIIRQTYLSDARKKENDAEHAWHMAIMTVMLSEYANSEIDVLKTMTMLLIHDIVEIDTGDTYAYDEEAKKTQAEREMKAAKRIFGLLPEDQGEKMMNLWLEFESGETAEAKFAHTMDNIQPACSMMQPTARRGLSILFICTVSLTATKTLLTAQKSCGNIQGITLLCPMLKRAE